MTQEITTFTADQQKTLTEAGIIPQGTPVAQIKLFAAICGEKGLSPFNKQIYLVGYAGKYSVITGIDGFRALASRSGLHAGTDDCKFDLQPDGAFKTIASYQPGDRPETATVTVYKVVAGIRVPFTHTVKFKEFSTGKNKWAEMPFQMISKVAESFALRKAFPELMAGLRIEEEQAAIEGITEAAPKAKELPELTPQHPNWGKAVAAIAQGTAVDLVRTKYTLSLENEQLLILYEQHTYLSILK